MFVFSCSGIFLQNPYQKTRNIISDYQRNNFRVKTTGSICLLKKFVVNLFLVVICKKLFKPDIR